MATSTYGSLKALLERFDEHHYTKDHLQRLIERWNRVDELARIIETGALLTFETSRLSLVELERQNRTLFDQSDKGRNGFWWSHLPFAKSPRPRGQVISIMSVDAAQVLSLNLSWETQEARVTQDLFGVPSARDLVEAYIMHFHLLGQRMHPDLQMRTSDVAPFQERVCVRWTDDGRGPGLRLLTQKDSDHLEVLGVATAYWIK